MKNQNAQELIDSYDEELVKAISYEYGRLIDWFEEEFPEHTIRLDINADRRHGKVEYTLSILTGKSMVDNQLALKNSIVIDGYKFRDTFWMNKFINSINPNYKKAIVKSINEHYALEKQREGVRD
jgi:hypothetical protein